VICYIVLEIKRVQWESQGIHNETKKIRKIGEEKMSLCGICYGHIEDGKPDSERKEDLSYDGCEEEPCYNEGR